jgi:hypothetical protein
MAGIDDVTVVLDRFDQTRHCFSLRQPLRQVPATRFLSKILDYSQQANRD